MGRREQKMKKIICICTILVCSLFLTACGSGETKYYKEHPARELLEGEDPVAVRRYAGFSEDTYYSSYGVYGELSEEELLQIAEYVYLAISGKSEKDGGKSHNLGGKEVDYSFAFYKEDSEERIDAFMYKDGERQPSSEEDIFIPGSQYGILEGAEE